MGVMCGVFYIISFLSAGCQSQRLNVHGNSAIMSHDAKLKLDRLAIRVATEQDVISILGEPSNSLFEEDGSKVFFYGCVATVWKERYLFSRRAIMTTNLDTSIYTCKISFDGDGRLEGIDYRQDASDKTMQVDALTSRR